MDSETPHQEKRLPSVRKIMISLNVIKLQTTEDTERQISYTLYKQNADLIKEIITLLAPEERDQIVQLVSLAALISILPKDKYERISSARILTMFFYPEIYTTSDQVDDIIKNIDSDKLWNLLR